MTTPPDYLRELPANPQRRVKPPEPLEALPPTPRAADELLPEIDLETYTAPQGNDGRE